jgi:hypothetical protein
MRRLLVRASVVPRSSILVTLMKEAISSSETSVLTRATWRNSPEDTILHSLREIALFATIYHCSKDTAVAGVYCNVFGPLYNGARNVSGYRRFVQPSHKMNFDTYCSTMIPE